MLSTLRESWEHNLIAIPKYTRRKNNVFPAGFGNNSIFIVSKFT
jgi:hypothetical protein